MNICVFCSQYEVSEKYKTDAETLARLIAEHKHTLVWGGADEGLMGLIARTAQRGGAKVIGVIREKIKDKAYKNADEMIVVKDAREMNLGLIERGDMIVVLVGGIGTLNEVTEVLRMRKNGLLNKQIIVINTDHFYDGFKAQLERMSAEGFLKKEVMDSAFFADTPEEAMWYIEKNHR
ncbi:MAG: TIGR00730 family Rossman fold protein [Patescibacteria group bacterium]